MAADRRGPMLARIAEVRGQRLTRAATEAHEASEAALVAAERARQAREAAAATRQEARAAFVSTPACAQARLWLDRTIAGETGAVAELSDRSARLDLARDAHLHAVGALARHQVRSDVIAAHHRDGVRADQRRAEDRLEAETPIARVRAS